MAEIENKYLSISLSIFKKTFKMFFWEKYKKWLCSILVFKYNIAFKKLILMIHNWGALNLTSCLLPIQSDLSVVWRIWELIWCTISVDTVSVFFPRYSVKWILLTPKNCSHLFFIFLSWKLMGFREIKLHSHLVTVLSAGHFYPWVFCTQEHVLSLVFPSIYSNISIKYIFPVSF